MPQAGESVFFSTFSDFKPVEMKCDHTASKVGWRFVGVGKTDPGLIENMLRDRGVAKPVWPPASKSRSIDFVEPGAGGIWPSQAHHLIPHKQLAGHPIKQYLQAGDKLLADSNYSVNHGNNGKFMPYVSDVIEWKKANAIEKHKLANRMMQAAGIQLHQGPHSFKSYGGGKVGYKDEVDRLLKRIHVGEWLHHKRCEQCKSKANGNKFPPRETMSRKVDWVSSRLEYAINANNTFVSHRAYLWWQSLSTTE
jgi:A nuclease family of the HNH/ENDO VII superfamily with conserved AHH